MSTTPDPSNKPGLKLVVFDLGGVMVRLQPSWEAAFGAAGLPTPPKLGELDVAKQIRDLVQREEQGLLGKRGFFSGVASMLGVKDVDIEAASDRYLVEPYPGVVELLAELKATPAQTACLSNTNQSHWEHMTSGDGHARLPLEMLDFHFASHELGLRKPDPEIYKRVSVVTSVLPENIVFFDDLEDNILGARQAGWSAHQIDPKEDPVAQCREHLADYDLS